MARKKSQSTTSSKASESQSPAHPQTSPHTSHSGSEVIEDGGTTHGTMGTTEDNTSDQQGNTPALKDMIHMKLLPEQWNDPCFLEEIERLEALFMELTQCNLDDINLFYTQLLLYAYGEDYEDAMDREEKLLDIASRLSSHAAPSSSSSSSQQAFSTTSPTADKSTSKQSSSSIKVNSSGKKRKLDHDNSNKSESDKKKSKHEIAGTTTTATKSYQNLHMVNTIALDSPLLSTLAKGFLLRLYHGFSANTDLLIFRNTQKARQYADYLFPWFANQWYHSNCPNACRYVAYLYGVCNLVRLESKRFEDDDLLAIVRHCYEYRVYEVQDQDQHRDNIRGKSRRRNSKEKSSSKQTNALFEQIQPDIHRLPSEEFDFDPVHHPNRFTRFMPIVLDLSYFYEHRLFTGQDEETFLGIDFLRYAVQSGHYLCAMYRLGILYARGKMVTNPNDEEGGGMSMQGLLWQCMRKNYSDARIRFKQYLLVKILEPPAPAAVVGQVLQGIDEHNNAAVLQAQGYRTLLQQGYGIQLPEFSLSDEVLDVLLHTSSSTTTTETKTEIPVHWGLASTFGSSDLPSILDHVYNKACSSIDSTAGLLMEPNIIGLCRRAGARYVHHNSIPILREECHLKMDRLIKAVLHILIEKKRLLHSQQGQQGRVTTGRQVIHLQSSSTSIGKEIAKRFDITLFNEEDGFQDMQTMTSRNLLNKDKAMQEREQQDQSQSQNEVFALNTQTATDTNTNSMFRSYLETSLHDQHQDQKHLDWQGFCQSLHVMTVKDHVMKWELIRFRALVMQERCHFTSASSIASLIRPLLHQNPLQNSLSFLFSLDNAMFRYITSYLGFNPSISYLDSYQRFPIDQIALSSGEYFPKTLKEWEVYCEQHSMSVTDSFPSSHLTILHIQAGRGVLRDVEDLILRYGMSPNTLVIPPSLLARQTSSSSSSGISNDLNAEEDGEQGGVADGVAEDIPDSPLLEITQRRRMRMFGFTPLHFAANNGYHEVVRRLLELGAIDCRSMGQCVGLRQFADNAENENTESAEGARDEDLYWQTRLETIAPSSQNGETALLGAVKAGHDKVVRELLLWRKTERLRMRREVRHRLLTQQQQYQHHQQQPEQMIENEAIEMQVDVDTQHQHEDAEANEDAEEELIARDLAEDVSLIESWQGLDTVSYCYRHIAGESDNDRRVLHFPNGLLYQALAHNRIGVVRELVHHLSICRLHHVTDLLPTLDHDEDLPLRSLLLQRMLCDQYRPDVRNFISSALEFALESKSKPAAPQAQQTDIDAIECAMALFSGCDSLHAFSRRYFSPSPTSQSSSSTLDRNNLERTAVEASASAPAPAPRTRIISPTALLQSRKEQHQRHIAGEESNNDQIFFAPLIHSILADHFSSRRPFESLAIQALNTLIEISIERLIFLIHEQVKSAGDTSSMPTSISACYKHLQDHLFGIDHLDQDETLLSCAHNSPLYYKQKYPKYSQTISQALVIQRLSESPVIQALCYHAVNSTVAEKIVCLLSNTTKSALPRNTTTPLKSKTNTAKSQSSSNSNAAEDETSLSLMIPSKYLLSTLKSYCDQVEFWLYYVIEGSHNESYFNSPFYKTVTLENVQNFVENHDIFARYKLDEIVAVGHMNRFGLDEEDGFIHDAYLRRRQLVASSYAYKTDTFELDPIITRYEHPRNDPRFIVCNAQREIEFYRQQTHSLVIPFQDFRSVFLHRFQVLLNRFLGHQYGLKLDNQEQPSTTTSANASSISVVTEGSTEHSSRMPIIKFDDHLLTMIQFLFEYMMTKYLNSVHNTYCTPWLMIAFRVNPHTASFLVSAPTPSEQQQQEIDFIRQVLTQEEIERRYNCDGTKQDIQAHQLWRRSLGLDLGES